MKNTLPSYTMNQLSPGYDLYHIGSFKKYLISDQDQVKFDGVITFQESHWS